MEKEIKLSCPCCGAILFVDRISGQVIETRKPILENSTGDRLEDAFIKSKEDKEKRESLFDNMKQIHDQKKKIAEDIFKASLESAKKTKDEKPRSVFDAD